MAERCRVVLTPSGCWAKSVPAQLPVFFVHNYSRMHDVNGTLLAKAVVLALVTVDSLPPESQNLKERDNLVHLLGLLVQDPLDREMLAMDVEVSTGRLS
jgi:hypothetical protein